MKISGIYKIESKKKPEKCYIGSAVNIYKRWNDHMGRLRNNNHKNRKLQNHFNKYGETDLIFSILLSCDIEYLIANEQFFIDSYKPWFNNNPIAGSMLGFKHSEETKQKNRELSKGNTNRRGKPCSEETKNLLRGKHHSEESKALLRIARYRQNNPRPKGCHVSEITKEKLRLVNIGRKASEETKQKMRGKTPWNKGKKLPSPSDETKRKMSLIRKGKRQAEGFGQKIKDSWIIRRQKKLA